MTRLLLSVLIILTPSFAAAWGKSSYYSYDSDRSASYTATSSDRGVDDQQETDKAGAESVSK